MRINFSPRLATGYLPLHMIGPFPGHHVLFILTETDPAIYRHSIRDLHDSPPSSAGSFCVQLAVHSIAHTCRGQRSEGDEHKLSHTSTHYTVRATGADHCLKGVASIWTMQFLTRVFVLTSSLLLALYTTSNTRVFLVTAARERTGLVTGHMIILVEAQSRRPGFQCDL